MTNNYLPQFSVTLNDLGLKVAPPPAGPKVTLLGITSNTGVTLFEPYTIQSVEKAINSLYFTTDGTEYGGSWSKSGNWPGELALAIEEASNAGAENIEVMVIAHKTGEALLDYIRPDASKASRFSDLSGAYDVLRNRELDIVVPVGVYIDDSTDTSNQNFGKQLADFCFQATQENNACVGVIATQPPLHWLWDRRSALSGNAIISGELQSLFNVTVSGGVFTGVVTSASHSTGVSNALKNVFFGTPSTTLLGEWARYHYTPYGSDGFLTNVHSSKDTIYQAWQYGAVDQDGNFLNDTSDTSSTAVSPTYFASWQAKDSSGTNAVDARGVKVDAGGYISVLTAPLVALGTQVSTLALAVGAPPSSLSYNTGGAAAYAGLVTSLAPQSATTNKQIPGLNSSKLLSATQANKLTGIRHTTLYSRTRGLTVAKDVTGAYNVTRYVRSDYNLLTTVRITQAVVDAIRAAGERYIGEPNNAPQLNALDNDIEAVLLSFKGAGALNDYVYSISSTPDQRVLGIVSVDLTIVPAFEILEIQLTVSLASEI